MTLRPPQGAGQRLQTGVATLDHELAEEMAVSLGRAGERVARSLEKLRAEGEAGDARQALLKEAARAVHAYFIQRELCGLRRHDDAIREYGIPHAVLARLGAS